MPTRLTLLCHAATSATRRAAFPDDEPIEDMASATPLDGTAFASYRALTSPALCARQTAAALGKTAAIDPDLRDCDYGRWRGRAFADIQAAEPEALAQWTGDPEFDGHGGESIIELLARAEAWLRRSGTEGGRLLAITHPAVMRAAIVRAIGAPPASFWRIDIAPLAHAELREHQGRWTLRSIGAA